MVSSLKKKKENQGQLSLVLCVFSGSVTNEDFTTSDLSCSEV